MERFWNLIHYFVYKAHYKSHLIFNKINPVFYFYNLPFAKRHFEKKGINPVNEVNKAFKRVDFGLSSLFAGGFMNTLVLVIFLGLLNIYSGLVQQKLNLNLFDYILTIGISLIINYHLLFKHDKYIAYFKEFDKMEIDKKRKCFWTGLLVLLGILLYFIGSYIYLSYRIY